MPSVPLAPIRGAKTDREFAAMVAAPDGGTAMQVSDVRMRELLEALAQTNEHLASIREMLEVVIEGV